MRVNEVESQIEGDVEETNGRQDCEGHGGQYAGRKKEKKQQ